MTSAKSNTLQLATKGAESVAIALLFIQMTSVKCQRQFLLVAYSTLK